MNNINVVQKIMAFRKGAGLTSKHLAEIADTTPSMLSKIEQWITGIGFNQSATSNRFISSKTISK